MALATQDLDRETAEPRTGTVGKALSVLDIVAQSDEPLRFTDIFEQAGQPRGTLHRQLTHLVEEGLLSVGRNQTYSLGLRLLRLAARSWSRNDFRKVAEPHLRVLHEETGETVHLGVLQGHQVVYLDKVESRQSVRMHSQIGNASPVYCTGVGKAALSVLPDDRLRQIVDGIEFRRFTAHTLPGPAELLAEIAEIRRTGNAYDREEHEAGIRCVAAPVHTADMQFVAGISVTGPAYRVTMDDLEGWAQSVRKTARAIAEDTRVQLGPRA